MVLEPLACQKEKQQQKMRKAPLRRDREAARRTMKEAALL